MDVKYVKGMINNPDLQLNTTINRRFSSILLFHFKLIHILVDKHTGPDGLSQRPPAKRTHEEDNIEDWLDDVYSFSMALLNEHSFPELHATCRQYSHLALLLFYCRSKGNLGAHSVYSLALQSPEPNPQILEVDAMTIPRSPKAKAWEDHILLIHHFLESQECWDGMSDKDYQSFLNLATCFFILNGALWWCKSHGKHQLVIPESWQFRLIKEAHDDLRHKGVFTVQTQLLLWFWCLMLVEHVKWFIHTCHACQTHQMMKIHIPPMVLLISRLFHKVHIDTMLMPKAGGYWYIVQARCVLTSYPEWCMLHLEKRSGLIFFIFEDILC